MLANDVLHTVGNTPHSRIDRLFGSDHNVDTKSERTSPMGSINERIAGAMVAASGATLAAVARNIPELAAATTVLGCNDDTGERCRSIAGFRPE